MLKAKCIECSDGKATFLFNAKQPKVGEYYHLEEQTGKSLELNGLFHALFPEFYYWMFNKDQFIFNDGGIELDFRCSDKWKLKDLLKQKYGEGNYYQYADMNYSIVKEKSFSNIPIEVLDDFNAGNTDRIKLVLKSWGAYTENQASRLVDIIIKLMNKLGVDTPKYLDIVSYLETKKENEYNSKLKDKFR